MILCGIVTLIMGVVFWFFVPDSPMTARFLNEREKVVAIERLSHQSSGIENKTWKREQFIEAMTDWKVWAVSNPRSSICSRRQFFFLSAISQLPNSLLNQWAMIISERSVSRTSLTSRVFWLLCLANRPLRHGRRCY